MTNIKCYRHLNNTFYLKQAVFIYNHYIGFIIKRQNRGERRILNQDIRKQTIEYTDHGYKINDDYILCKKCGEKNFAWYPKAKNGWVQGE